MKSTNQNWYENEMWQKKMKVDSITTDTQALKALPVSNQV